MKKIDTLYSDSEISGHTVHLILSSDCIFPSMHSTDWFDIQRRESLFCVDRDDVGYVYWFSVMRPSDCGFRETADVHIDHQRVASFQCLVNTRFVIV